MLISDTPAWKSLAAHASEIQGTHLRTLLTDEARAAYKLALEKLDDKSSLKPLIEIRLDALGG